MASVLAQFIAETTEEDVLDDGDTTKLVSLLISSVNTVARSALPVGTPIPRPLTLCRQTVISLSCRGRHSALRHTRYWLQLTRQVSFQT